MSFGAYVAALASGLDVAVDVVVAGTDTRVHDGFPPRPERREQWLGDVSYVNAGPNERFRSLVTAAAPRLREIRDEQGCYGLAAISVSVPPHGSFLSLKSVGGIATPHHPDQDQSFVGLIDCIPANAQRSAGEMRAPQGALQSWLSEQANLLIAGGATDLERIYASYSLCNFGYDPMDLIRSVVIADRDERGSSSSRNSQVCSTPVSDCCSLRANFLTEHWTHTSETSRRTGTWLPASPFKQGRSITQSWSMAYRGSPLLSSA